MDYDNNILDEKMRSLPEDLQSAMNSVDLINNIKEIANSYSLNIDQTGQLEDVISSTILGLTKSENFVSELVKKAEIKSEIAMQIAKDVNKRIFDSVRDSLRKIQSQAESESQNQTPVEEEVAAVEPTLNKEETVASIEHAGDFKIENTQPQSSSPQYKETDINREALLKGIEDAPVPLVDHLLTTPISNEKVVEVKDVTDTKADALDPYREKI